MSNLLFPIFAFFFHLLREVIHFVRFGRPTRTVSMPSARPQACPVPSSAPQNTPQRDPMAELALLKAENRVTMREANALRREMNERRRLEREAARARGELPPAKPRKPRQPQPITPPKALPDAPPTLTAASPVIPSRPTPSQATQPRTLFKTLSRILAAPLRILKAVLLALPRLWVRLLPRRRPPSDGPPMAQPPIRTLSNRAA